MFNSSQSRPMNNNFYVYVYLDPRKPGDYNYGEYHFDYEPFYVGKGNGKRYKQHLLYGNPYNDFFNKKIKKIQKICNTNPIIIKYKDMLLEKDSFNLEIKMINTIGRYDLKKGPLCNLMEGGHGGSGYRFPKELKNKLSEIAKNRPPMSEETKRKISINSSIKLLGHSVSEETKKKISKANKGKQSRLGKLHTEETKKKIKLNRGDLSGKNNPMFGKKQSNETKQKLSEIAKNRPPMSEETKRKISESSKGRIVSDKTRRKLSKANDGSTRYIWYIKTPENIIEKVISLKYWCKNKMLSYSSMRVNLLKYGKNKNYILVRRELYVISGPCPD